MNTLGRRQFLLSSGAATLTLSLATLATSRRAGARDYGELVPDPEGILDLPPGFSYTILEEAGATMDDGYRVPGRPDGMACFAGPMGTLILMRNHENNANDPDNGPYMLGQTPPPEAYEPAAAGGVTRVVLDAQTFERVSSNLVLIGTIRNCAGGPSPWGWLSCEENTSINGPYRHGYVFRCPIDAASVVAPERILGYGRFNHEAVAIDPSNYYAYLTEDRGDSCLYRFVPNDMAQPFFGKLQALKIVGVDAYETTTMGMGEVLEVEWVDVVQTDPDGDSVRIEAQDKGAATFVRGEGIWFFEGQVYVCSTSGGPAEAGQIFRLIDGDAPTLELVVASTDPSVLDYPDNITVAPWGEVFMAEDGDGDNFIRWVTADGQICDFARNALSDSEFAGVCFSPDGRAMFVNIQSDGLTLAITGPFPMLPMPGDESTGDESTGDESTSGDESTGDTSGDESTSGESDTSGGETSGGETSGSGGEGTGDELGGESESESGTSGAVDAAGEGCGCSTSESTPASSLLMTGVAALGLAALVRERE
jgi:MYXO-CTERM domain-containing protein